MSIVSGIFTYLMIWWVVLFFVLPWGNAPAENPGPGMMAGAPANPRTRKKLIVTTLLSLLVWAVVFALIQSHYFSFRALVKDFPE